MEYPSDGVAIQEACYPKFGTCLVDTFHRAKLKQELVDQYKGSKYSIFGYVDSVKNFENYDTTWYRGEINFIDTFTNERIHISVHSDLKDSLPTRRLSFLDRWVAFVEGPFSTTYTALRDTPFVAFFNKYDSIHHLGIGPMDGCFFEPNVYHVLGGRIHKKGLHGYRMPGVSVSLEEFFQAVGRDPVPAPPVGILRRRLPSAVVESTQEGQYDILGRRRDPMKSHARFYELWGPPVTKGRKDRPTDGVSRP